MISLFLSMRTSLLFILVLVFPFVMVSCSKNEAEKPINLIPEDTFITILAEFELINAQFNLTSDSLLATTTRDSVLKVYQIKLDQFYESEVYYHHDINKYQELLNKAMDKLIEEQSQIFERRKN